MGRMHASFNLVKLEGTMHGYGYTQKDQCKIGWVHLCLGELQHVKHFAHSVQHTKGCHDSCHAVTAQ